VVSFTQPIFGAPGRASVRVQVSQTLRSRKALARAILFRALGQQVVLVLLVVLALWLGLAHALAPVMRLSQAVRSRRPGALEPLETSSVPAELKPLAVAINDYVSRLESQMSAHSRFIGNAAHQLRTPLALLNTQVACALRSAADQEKDEAIHSIRESVQHGTRVVNQLLMLSVAESGGAAIETRDVDLVRIVHDALEQCAAAAQAKRIDLGFEHHGEATTIRGVPSMMRELVANLLDNAVRYTPAGGTVTAKVAFAPGEAELLIEDSGPGIPSSEREHVFERFYRLHHDASDGCGLGLAIVREIAAACGAEVTLGDGPGGRGLSATVRFQVSAAAPVAASPARNDAHLAASTKSVV
jgi:two-component system sensor histidine kinase TctE